MHIIRYRLAGSLIFLMISFVAIGCGKQSPGKSDISGEQTKEITIAFWSDIYNAQFARKMVSAYNATNPEIKVKFFPIEGGAYDTKIKTLIAGGTAQDIMLLIPEQLIEFASRGTLLDLSPYWNSPEFQEIIKDTFPSCVESAKYTGKPYGVPAWNNTVGLFYNKQIFNEAGAPYPDNTWDWNMLLNAAQKLTVPGKRFGLKQIDTTIFGWDSLLFIMQNGGRCFSPDMRKCLIDSPEAVEALQFVVDLKRKYHVSPTGSAVSSGQFGKYGAEAFISGQIAMFISGRWDMEFLKKAGSSVDYGVAVFPKGRTRYMIAGSTCFVASSKTAFPEGCVQFFKYIMGRNGQELINAERSDIPVSISVCRSQEYMNAYEKPNANKTFIEQFKYAEPPPILAGAGEWKSLVQIEIEMVELGNKSVSDAARAIVRAYERMGVNKWAK